jgi:hypothetical protein
VSLALAATIATAANATESPLSTTAYEARQAISVINGFYVAHHACPRSSWLDEMAELQHELGDGYSVEPREGFAAIRSISMAAPWFYYASSRHPERCTLWRPLDGDTVLIWRRQRDAVKWTLEPGDGRNEKPLHFAP